ncbi:MAG: rRNA maturation RNase YbeY [Planctomycetales bacterium]|nr:rRNA maturation RNase YbeY [Planctomycetales bacterium]
MDLGQIELDIEYFTSGTADDSQRFHQAAAWIAKQYNVPHLRLSVSIVDDATIRAVNRDQLQHDWATDVISFQIECTDKLVDGEVIASAETAARLSKQAGWHASDELLLYVVHGMLHVVGLDDIQQGDRLQMRNAERDCLTALQVANAQQLQQHWQNFLQ